MLQIISGKFFKSENRHIYQGRGVTFSNYSWVQPIKTCVATLEPVETYFPVSTYIISFTNQIEKGVVGSSKGIELVQTGTSEIIQQFQLLCFFGLKALFLNDKNSIEIYTRKIPKASHDKYIPSRFVPRFFNSQLGGEKSEIEDFIDFVKKVIGLPRKKYNVVIYCLKNFAHSLQILNYNIDLAYSMLVYSLDSLSQNFDEFIPTWKDYDQDIRGKLDSIFSKIDSTSRSEIKEVLLRSRNFRLQHRFINFIENHINDNFFIEEASKINNSLKKSELRRSLKNVYAMRSKFVHQLEPIQQQIRISGLAGGDIFYWKKEPYLTYSGLARLTYHVVATFIEAQEYLEKEDYNWKEELPGTIRLEIPPKNWVGLHKGFQQNQATKKLSGFLEILEEAMLTNGTLVKLDKLMEIYESLIPNARARDRIPMLALYYVYNLFITSDAKRPDYKKFLMKYEKEFNTCCIEMMVVYLLSKQRWIWDVKRCVSHYQKYCENKYNKDILHIPKLFELSLMSEFANTYLRAGNIDTFMKWLDEALLEAAGKPKIQEVISEHKSAKREVDYEILFKVSE